MRLYKFSAICGYSEGSMKKSTNHKTRASLIRNGKSSKVSSCASKCFKKKEASSISYICPHCEAPFTQKSNLFVHMRKVHSAKKNQRYECDFCNTSFTHKRDLEEHNLNCNQNSTLNISSDRFECAKCKHKFLRKNSLLSHINRCSMSNTNYPCRYCSRTFSTLDSATLHKKVCSQNTTNNNSFQCSFCLKFFKEKDALSNHSKTCTSLDSGKKTVTCIRNNCTFTCFNKTNLIDHLRIEHDHILPVQNLTFNSESEFQAWKEVEEAQTYSYFPQSTGAKRGRLYLYCQQDGSDRPHRAKGTESRKTSRKVKFGQIKTGKVCLAKMVVVRNKDGSRKVEYYKTHSHPCSKDDVVHQPVLRSTATFINTQLALNISPSEIVSTLRSSSTARNLTITERTIYQRAARMQSSIKLYQNDAVSISMIAESLQKEKYNPVVLYKPMDKNFIMGPKKKFAQKFSKDLFMFGLQTKEQRELLVKYSSKVVVIGVSDNITQRDDMKLLSMLVTDENNKGWPVGHLISNHISAEILKLFIYAIKVRCEIAGEVLSINCIISNDDPTLTNSIEEGMDKSIHHILCHWDLNKNIKEAIRLKSPIDMFDTIYKKMKVLITENNLETFSSMFDAFLKRHSDEAPEFVKHVEDYYSKIRDKWAMCYRENLGHGNINTTAHVESFHNHLKSGVFKRVDDLINTLLALQKRNLQERKQLELLDFSELAHQCSDNHIESRILSDSSIEEVWDDMWLVKTTEPQSYYISRVEDLCQKGVCYDRCYDPSCCGLCTHLFICSCEVTNRLCKHVHKLQRLIAKGSPVFDREYEEDPEDELYKVEEEVKLSPVVLMDEFDEADAYCRLEYNLATLSHLVFQRSIPEHLLLTLDSTISDLVKRCNLSASSAKNSG